MTVAQFCIVWRLYKGLAGLLNITLHVHLAAYAGLMLTAGPGHFKAPPKGQAFHWSGAVSGASTHQTHTQRAISMHSDKHSHIHSTLKASAASTCQTHASMILTTYLDVQKAYEWTLVYSFLSYWASSRSHSVIYGRLILQHNQTDQSQLRNMLGLPWQTTVKQQLKSKVQMKGLQFSSRSAF